MAMKLVFGFYHGGEGPNRIATNPLDEILDAAPRACAVVVAAICEKRIEQAIKAELTDDADVLNALFQPDGPIGGFRPKIFMAFAMGLVGQVAFKDLKIIAGIRNDFAHKFDVDSFESQSVAARCANLQLPEMYYGEVGDPPGKQYYQGGCAEALKDPRSRYVATCMLVADNVAMAIDYPEHPKAKPPYI